MCTKSTTVSWMALLVFLGAVTLGCTSETAKQANKSDKPSSPALSKKTAAAPDKSAKPGKMATSPTEDTKTSAPADKKDDSPAVPIDAEKFPKPTGAEKPMYTSDTSTMMFHQAGNVEDQAKFYTEELGKLGWKKESSSEISDGVGFFDFTKGSLSITVTINPLREGMITTIVQGDGLSVPESLEQDDDDEGTDDCQ